MTADKRAVKCEVEALARPCDIYSEPGQDCITAGPEVMAAEGVCGPCLARRLAEARAEGVNDGIRLAAQLVRDHVLGGSSERVADFLTSRADRARAAAEQAQP